MVTRSNRFWLVVLLLLSVAAGGFPPFTHTARASSTADAGQKKTVHVKEYKRKDGTTVRAHERKAPSKKSGTSTSTSSSKSRKSTGQPSVHTSSSVARDEDGRIERSESAKRAFMRRTGFPNGRPGYVVDHIRPLACGGRDEPSNMQWQTIADAKAKDKIELRGCR